MSTRVQEFQQAARQLRWELENDINRMPMEDARSRAAALLADPAKFRCIVARAEDDEQFASLSPDLRAFFETYESVVQEKGDLFLARSEVEPSIVGSGFIKIGDSGQEHCHLAVLPGEDTVYEVSEEESYKNTKPSMRMASVYHCLIYHDRYESRLARWRVG